MQSRIYEVKNTQTGATRLVVAHNPAQATRHVVNGMFEVKAASAVTVGRLMSEGIKLEQAGADIQITNTNITGAAE